MHFENEQSMAVRIIRTHISTTYFNHLFPNLMQKHLQIKKIQRYRKNHTVTDGVYYGVTSLKQDFLV
ncbi:hypothetical protein Hanom_Chr06g00559041 [Helianthus anomalus]